MFILFVPMVHIFLYMCQHQHGQYQKFKNFVEPPGERKTTIQIKTSFKILWTWMKTRYEKLLDLYTGDISQEYYDKLQQKINDKLAHFHLSS